VVVTVEDTGGNPEPGLKIYAFDDTHYTGYNKTTDTNGQATFTLSMGDYRFRADKNSTQFWSNSTNHCTLPGCTAAVVTTTVPVTVTVQDSSGTPESSLKVYAFDGTTYTGYNKTTDASGQATFTLPQGHYRFRADKDGTQFWSNPPSAGNHCAVPGCTTVTVSISEQAMRLPENPVLALAEMPVPAGSKLEVSGDLVPVAYPLSSSRSPGLAALVEIPSQIPDPAALAESGELITVTRVITQVYDPLGRLVASNYSTGETFAYQYDAVGNRTAMTSVTLLSGTLATTYTHDAANRLTDRAVSDGRVYTYTWSASGQLLAEWTEGYPVRTFTYDGAGRLVEATVFTLTTRFTYNGLGARVAVEVVGHGTTTYTLDYAAGDRILVEKTGDSATLYLYGHDCLGELRDDDWLYYLNDAEELVRQGTDERGEVVSAWLFDPDRTVLEGPEGPVSHLVCGGVYDWSTGLIYKDGNYFDPMLGIWLALAPLMVVQSWRRRKRKGRRFPWYVVVLLGVCMSGLLTACQGLPPEAVEATLCVEVTPTPHPMPKPDDGSHDEEILRATVLINFKTPLGDKNEGDMHDPSWLGTIVERLPDGSGRIITHAHFDALRTDYYLFADYRGQGWRTVEASKVKEKDFGQEGTELIVPRETMDSYTSGGPVRPLGQAIPGGMMHDPHLSVGDPVALAYLAPKGSGGNHAEVFHGNVWKTWEDFKGVRAVFVASGPVPDFAGSGDSGGGLYVRGQHCANNWVMIRTPISGQYGWISALNP
jgi:YD repeat-containing protein